jgi:hypothetical protein
MTEHHIAYREVRVESSPVAEAEYRSIGGTGVFPLLVINGKRMPAGFNSGWFH